MLLMISLYTLVDLKPHIGSDLVTGQESEQKMLLLSLMIMTIILDASDALSANSIDTQANAQNAVTNIATAINTLSGAQADVGSYINRLQFNVSNLSQAAVVAEKTLGTIMDADYAKETSNLAKNQILSQAATSMLAQANQSKQSVLALLQ